MARTRTAPFWPTECVNSVGICCCRQELSSEWRQTRRGQNKNCKDRHQGHSLFRLLFSCSQLSVCLLVLVLSAWSFRCCRCHCHNRINIYSWAHELLWVLFRGGGNHEPNSVLIIIIIGFIIIPLPVAEEEGEWKENEIWICFRGPRDKVGN